MIPPALSPRQRMALTFLVEDFGSTFDHSKENLTRIAKHMHMNHTRGNCSAADMLFSLRHKGYLASEGRSQKVPERWRVLVTENRA